MAAYARCMGKFTGSDPVKRVKRGPAKDTLEVDLAGRVREAVVTTRALRRVGWEQLGREIGMVPDTVMRAVGGSERMSLTMAVKLLLWCR